jgi:hypothetical protein
MSVLFFLPLIMIAFFESQITHSRSDTLRAYFSGPPPEEDEESPDVVDPKGDEEGEISTVKFDNLIECFPK